MKTRSFGAVRKTQRGAALVVSLILLLVMTVLALSMSQTSRMQERMAGNTRDYDLAFQAAETALRGAEARLHDSAVKPDLCPEPTADLDSCMAVEKGALASSAVDLRSETPEWWAENAKPFGSSGKDMADLYGDPLFVTEKVGTHKIDGLSIGRGQPPEREFYKITATGFGRGQDTRAMLESVVADEPR